MKFAPRQHTLLIADKSGDVFILDVKEENFDESQAIPLLMGHISMLLDLTFCGKEGEYLAICDRDEKVRICCFPNCYSVQSFCLGHKQYVSALVYIEELDLLISGSGDHTLASWDFSSGVERSKYNFRSSSPLEKDDCKETDDDDLSDSAESEEEPSSDHSTSEEDEDLLEIFAMSYCSSQKLLAVAAKGSEQIFVFKVSPGPQPVAGTLILETSWELEAAVIGLYFDSSSGCLWCLSQNSQVPLQAFVIDDNKHMLTLSDDKNVKRVVDSFMAEDSKMIADLLQYEEESPRLQKIKIDNITEYIEKKQDRLEKEVCKRK